ncbi:MAG: DNA alkylation repair protein [Bacteroidia bacterium]|nr:DNA alkylation repair protein [Bacteroidia bacterium]
MEPLKEMFNKNYYQHLAKILVELYPSFNAQGFVKDSTTGIEERSLNQRMRHTSLVLKEHLPDSYNKTIGLLSEAIARTRGGYTNLVFPDFVSQFGHHDFETSLNALQHFTKFGSSEFAIREFLKRDFDTTIRVMYRWSENENAHVRRLASEGSRPRLPWSFKLDEVINNPKITQPILNNLKADNELYVRKSVANHLNDITKENPDYMLALVNSWDKSHPHTAWIIKHASRTLIKKGHSGSLSVFDFEKNAKVKIEKFSLNKRKIKLGETLIFNFDVVSDKAKTQKLVVDYVIHYRKKSGELSPKVFKLKELKLEPKTTEHITKKQVFKDFTTRKHFAGKHLLEIQVNGKRLAQAEFDLVK